MQICRCNAHNTAILYIGLIRCFPFPGSQCLPILYIQNIWPCSFLDSGLLLSSCPALINLYSQRVSLHGVSKLVFLINVKETQRQSTKLSGDCWISLDHLSLPRWLFYLQMRSTAVLASSSHSQQVAKCTRQRLEQWQRQGCWRRRGTWGVWWQREDRELGYAHGEGENGSCTWPAAPAWVQGTQMYYVRTPSAKQQTAAAAQTSGNDCTHGLRRPSVYTLR